MKICSISSKVFCLVSGKTIAIVVNPKTHIPAYSQNVPKRSLKNIIHVIHSFIHSFNDAHDTFLSTTISVLEDREVFNL